MKEIDKISKDVSPSSLKNDADKKEISLKEIIEYFSLDDEYVEFLYSGKTYQTYKQLDLLKLIFNHITQEVDSFQSKNERDNDNTFFNFNKKILKNNITNTKEILKIYNIDEKKMLYFLIGTFIQYIYERKGN